MDFLRVITQWIILGLQDATSSINEQLTLFHRGCIVILVMIAATIGYLIIKVLQSTFNSRFLFEGQVIEFIWTLFPVTILIAIAFPSLHLLYVIDERKDADLTLKALGHQWYWSYEFSDLGDISFDSYMVPESELKLGYLRLLEVDSRVVIPYIRNIRVLVSAADVLHSWAVPRLGVKVDAVPGRLNQINFLATRPGVFYGQCSEICGANHSFMPIVLERVKYSSYLI